MITVFLSKLSDTNIIEAIVAPEVPDSGKNLMPHAESFGEGLLQIIQDLIPLIRPDLYEASRICVAIIAAVLMIAIMCSFSDNTKMAANISGTLAVSAAILMNMNSMIQLSVDTIRNISEYGKLLLPVMTAAMAAQGNVGTSAALYAGTSLFTNTLSAIISRILIPGTYVYMIFSMISCATGEDMLKNLCEMVKTAVGWILKTMLSLFVTYMGITGVISGTTDAAALKAAKASISTFVPVVGNVLSNVSESVLIGIQMAKNGAGLYGIFAVMSIFLGPFLKIGSHYILLKLTGSVCSVFGVKSMTELIGNFSSAMGLLLGMTGSVCMLQLISTVCFLKGVS